MDIPTYQEMMHPILTLANREPIKRQSAAKAMIAHFNLTEEQANALLPSGKTTYVRNRAGWALTYLTKAALIERVATATYAATERGRQFLNEHPNGFRSRDLRSLDGYKEAWETNKSKPDNSKKDPVDTDDDAPPEEVIETAVATLRAKLKSEVLDYTKAMDPLRFEQLVLDLMLRMGYGGSREGAGQLTQASNDGGVDGLINEDKLGLDVIYLQAKRYTDGTIGRPKIQEFVGALAGKQANKGVFITTSTFSSGAVEFANAVQQKIILIDGDRLADLMIEHNLGVAIETTYEVKRIDSDFFEQD
ncbi:restriction endonuclease [Cerasicoccus maritimus]|uniref:restriction endonuclease n=1 Tax=Cerasicoccus maritimus TaxID=490089 RepID=UPI0028526D1A|nr:restriction endonuclease [Cerasicoccus maritimus]